MKTKPSTHDKPSGSLFGERTRTPYQDHDGHQILPMLPRANRTIDNTVYIEARKQKGKYQWLIHRQPQEQIHRSEPCNTTPQLRVNTSINFNYIAAISNFLN